MTNAPYHFITSFLIEEMDLFLLKLIEDWLNYLTLDINNRKLIKDKDTYI